MPGSFTFNSVVIAASDCVSRGVEEAKAAIACNMALYKIWEAFDWRESLGEFPPFYLVPLVQDYGAPQVAVPSDFLGLRRAYYYNLSSGDVAMTKELTCPGDLPVADRCDIPQSICYRPATSKFRVSPLPPPSYGSPYHLIDGQYKKKPFTVLNSNTTTVVTRLTAATLGDALIPFGDVYLTMWIEAVKWALLTLADDPKAGQVQEQNGVVGYSGQIAKMMAEVGLMSGREAGELAAPPVHPAEAFMEY